MIDEVDAEHLNELTSEDELQQMIYGLAWDQLPDGPELRQVLDEWNLGNLIGAQSSRERPSSSDGDDSAPPPATRARTEEPQYQSMSASDADHAPPPAFRSLGSDEEVDEPVFRSAATAPAAAAAAPTATADTRCRLGEVALPPRRHVASLPPPLRAAAMAQLVAIARDTLRQRREGGAAAGAAAGVSSLADELEDLRQWIRFHCGSRP